MGLGFAAAQSLHVAAELGIADLLHDGPKSAEDLARATKTDAAALYRVLRFLASEGVFREEPEGRFAQTELSSGLRADAPDSPRDFIRMINREAYAAWGQLLYSVQTGGTAFDHVFGAPRFQWLANHPEQAALFQRAMIALSGPSQSGGSRGLRLRRPASASSMSVAAMASCSRRSSRETRICRACSMTCPGIEAARAGVGGPLPRCDLVAGDFFEKRA